MTTSFRYLSRLSELIQPFQSHQSIPFKKVKEKQFPFEINEIKEMNELSFRDLKSSAVSKSDVPLPQIGNLNPHRSLNQKTENTEFIGSPYKQKRNKEVTKDADKKNLKLFTEIESVENNQINASKNKIVALPIPNSDPIVEENFLFLDSKNQIFESKKGPVSFSLNSPHQLKTKDFEWKNKINSRDSKESKHLESLEDQGNFPLSKEATPQIEKWPIQEIKSTISSEITSAEQKKIVEQHINNFIQQNFLSERTEEKSHDPHFLKADAHSQKTSSLWSGWSQFINFGDPSL